MPIAAIANVPSLVLAARSCSWACTSTRSRAERRVVVPQLGYATDLIGIAPVGLFAFTYVALFAMARAAGVRLAAQTTMMQLTLAFAFSFVHGVMVLVLIAIFGRDAFVPRALYPLLPWPHAVATAVVAPLVFRLAQRI